MLPGIDPAKPLLTLDAKVVLLGLATAALTAAGTFFQKLNGVRVGSPLVSGWLVLAAIFFFPTFVITNKVFVMGGRLSLFVPVTATAYVLSMLLGRFYFGETVSWARWFGCVLIVAGVGAIARG
jgi:multidrug transporter EmrE-like cation transporter